MTRRCWDGKLAKMAHFAGMTYPGVLKSVLWASWERIYGRESLLKALEGTAAVKRSEIEADK